MNKKMLNLLFILIGGLSLILTYELYFVKNNEKIAANATQLGTLQDQIDQLDAKIKNESYYNQCISEWGSDIQKKSKEFVKKHPLEDQILYACRLEDDIDHVFINEIAPAVETELMTLNGAGMNFKVDTLTPEYAYVTDFDGIRSILDTIHDDSDSKKVMPYMQIKSDGASGVLTGVFGVTYFTVTEYGKDYKAPSGYYDGETKTENIFVREIEEETEEETEE